MNAYSIYNRAIVAGMLPLWLAVGMGAQQPPQPADSAGAQQLMRSLTPHDLVEKVIENELKVHLDGHFQYRQWDQNADGSKTKEVIETGEGSVSRLVAINDKPLTPAQQAEDNDRLSNLLRHPELQRKKLKEQQEDDVRIQRMFREFPKAFVYEYEGLETGASGELIKLKFTPNPSYEPPSHEAAVFKGMSGRMALQVPDYRLARIEGTLFKEVTFGWGVLGHLNQGGHFVVEQTRIDPERWDVTYMNVQFTGKILFIKSINLRETEKLTEYRKVPHTLTLAQGIAMLKEGGAEIAAK